MMTVENLRNVKFNGVTYKRKISLYSSEYVKSKNTTDERLAACEEIIAYIKKESVGKVRFAPTNSVMFANKLDAVMVCLRYP